jgi:PPM family protein phosphatase
MSNPAAVNAPLRAAAASDMGLRRENNEDRFLCDPARGLFVVIDGVGGHAAGETAAETAVRMIHTRLERETGSPAERVREAIALANNEIHRLASANEELHGMACVLTVALVRDGWLTVGHVGDSRLYEIRDGAVRKLTHDHSPVGEREDRGELDELEAMRHPRRNEIYRDVGTEPHRPDDEGFIEIIEQPFAPDSALLLCSDGLSDLVTAGTIGALTYRHADRPERAVERLISAANDAGGKDNITVVFALGPQFASAASAFTSAAALPQAGSTGPSIAAGSRGHAKPHSSTSAAHIAWILGTLIVGIVGGVGLAYAAFAWIDGVPDKVLVLAPPPAWSRVWSVGPEVNADATTIQAAIALARPGDVIKVAPGLYEGPLKVPAGVALVSRVRHEALIVPAPSTPPGTTGVLLHGGARISGFKIASAPADRSVRFEVGVHVEGEGAEVDDLDIGDTVKSAVLFAARTSAVLRSSRLSGNVGSAVVVEGSAKPRLYNNVISFNGVDAQDKPTPNLPAVPAVLVREGGVPLLVGNIIAKNAADVVHGLTPAQLVDVERENIIGVPQTPAARPGARRPERRPQ